MIKIWLESQLPTARDKLKLTNHLRQRQGPYPQTHQNLPRNNSMRPILPDLQIADKVGLTINTPTT